MFFSARKHDSTLSTAGILAVKVLECLARERKWHLFLDLEPLGSGQRRTLAHVFCKGPRSNISGFVGHVVSVTPTQFCHRR